MGENISDMVDKLGNKTFFHLRKALFCHFKPASGKGLNIFY